MSIALILTLFTPEAQGIELELAPETQKTGWYVHLMIPRTSILILRWHVMNRY